MMFLELLLFYLMLLTLLFIMTLSGEQHTRVLSLCRVLGALSAMLKFWRRENVGGKKEEWWGSLAWFCGFYMGFWERDLRG